MPKHGRCTTDSEKIAVCVMFREDQCAKERAWKLLVPWNSFASVTNYTLQQSNYKTICSWELYIHEREIQIVDVAKIRWSALLVEIWIFQICNICRHMPGGDYTNIWRWKIYGKDKKREERRKESLFHRFISTYWEPLLSLPCHIQAIRTKLYGPVWLKDCSRRERDCYSHLFLTFYPRDKLFSYLVAHCFLLRLTGASMRSSLV